MAAKVFIDGEAGTTGLQIRDRLVGRDDIALVSVAPERRKDPEARKDAFAEADVAILCLPDEAAREAVTLCEGLNTKLIDASTAHRTDDAWAFGFPELAAGRRDAIAAAPRVSNPGCYSTCAIALLAPLTAAGLLPGDAALSIFGISGYSGGGKSMIAEFESGQASGSFVYATGQTHKHLPEIVKYARLSTTPIFAPSVGQFAQGMVVQVPLFAAALPGRPDRAALHDALSRHYAGARFVTVRPLDAQVAREDPRKLNGTNRMELAVLGDDASGRLVLSAILDNLGKGASGAAVQNLNLMLGLDEGAGL
ncbi:N-acetyl-gamma-glutamyl-phosphate reductase [Oceaniglobus roseus]|uniref:N-acetyl-gamma-glutamyl-phosphate reductase n=1 Tax=Oceaniglobus roseus TaxID=1737570 RepID=UPI000C7E89CC|nr:N-acetyl-gamma-glutamyl-phosphate reductase [Kandeliimicrobium roseum]